MNHRQKARAVMARAHGAPVTVEDIWVDPPRAAITDCP